MAKEDIVKQFNGFGIIHQNRPGDQRDSHTHDEHQVIFPLQGEVTVVVSGVRHAFGPGRLLVIPAKTSHAFLAKSPKGERLVFYIDESIWQIGNNREEDVYLLPASQLLKELLFYCLLNSTAKNISLLRDTLLSVLDELVEDSTKTPIQDYRLLIAKVTDDRVKAALELLRQKLAEPPLMEIVAQESGLGLRTMNRLFQSQLGMGPKQILNLIRVWSAVELLNQGNLSITEIALEVGFGSTSSFISTFRKLTGRLPSDVRRFGWKEL